MIVNDLFESSQQCPECGGPAFSDLILAEKKDACYSKVRSRYKVWPSAYASGALVQCRKKGAANWGNKSEGVAEGNVERDKHYYLRNDIWRVMDGDELVHEYKPERYEIVGAKKLLARFDDEGYDVTHVISPMGTVTYLYGKPEDSLNELSPDLLQRSAQAAKNKSNQAMDPKIHDALGGGYMNPLAKHYDSLSQKFSNKAIKAGQRDAVKKIASPAVMRKIGMAKQDVAEGSVDQLPTQGADYSKYDTDHLKMMLRPGILHRNEARFKALIRKELQKREQQSQQGVAEGSLNEFAPGDGGDSGEEDTLRKFARMWYNGDDATQQRVEQALARQGWEIGELESEEGGAFVVQSGDEHGDSYIGFTADDLTEDVSEAKPVTIGSKLPKSDTATFGIEPGRGYKVNTPKDWKPGDRPRVIQQLIPTQDKKDHIRSRLGKHAAPVLPEQGVAEDSNDQVKKVFKKNGKPVGEVGIDPEASPGNGQWYMKCYSYNIDNSGYDSYEEAVEELKYCLKQGVAEAGRYGSRNPDLMSPSDYDRYQQDQMDQGRRDFKRREHEAEWEQEKAYSEKLAARDAGTWYIRINGKILKDKQGQPFTFRGKAAANRAAVTMMAKPFNAGKQFTLTTTAADRV